MPIHSVYIVQYHGKTSLSPNQTRTHAQGRLRVCDLCSSNFAAERNNFSLGAILVSRSISELKIPFSPVLEARTLFHEYIICFCNILSETFFLGLFLLLSLVFELQKPFPTGHKPRIFFGVFTS
jgi:hypothetical protein